MSSTKLNGYDFYNQVLKSPKYIVAPMVDQSEWAWRILSNRYGAHLSYTPMISARAFVESEKYRRENFSTGAYDRPLIAQFAGHNPQTLLTAAKMIQEKVDAVDINLGCPQHIAKRGRYGAYLQDEWELIASMVKLLHEELDVPVTVKIRIFPDVEKSIRYAQMLEAAGCQLLTVHGRTREQKGHNTGLADWEQIRRIKESVSIPVFANGNILYFKDIKACMDYTGVDGIMSAEGNLYNPALFTGKFYANWKLALEYLEIVKDFPNSASISAVRGHLFKIFHACLPDNVDIRQNFATCQTLEEFTDNVLELTARLQKIYGSEEEFHDADVSKAIMELPKWVLQPYFRKPLPPKKTIEKKTDQSQDCITEKKSKILIS
jgi:tRNA-dihydrouridine synthase 1